MVLLTIDALYPMERELVDVLRQGGVMTANQIHEVLSNQGRTTSRAAIRSRLSDLARMGVVVRESQGSGIAGTLTRWAVPN